MDLNNLPHAKINTTAERQSTILYVTNISSSSSYKKIMSNLQDCQECFESCKNQGVTKQFCMASQLLNAEIGILANKMSTLVNSSH